MKEYPARPVRRHTDRPETRATRPPARHAALLFADGSRHAALQPLEYS